MAVGWINELGILFNTSVVMFCLQLVAFTWKRISIQTLMFSLSRNQLVSSSWILFLPAPHRVDMIWLSRQEHCRHAARCWCATDRAPKIPCKHVKIKWSYVSCCFLPVELQIYIHHNYFSPWIHLRIMPEICLSCPNSFLHTKGCAAHFRLKPKKFHLFLQSLKNQ